MSLVTALLSILMTLLSQGAEAIQPKHSLEINRWLSANPEYVRATTKDCNCQEDIASMRRGEGHAWRAQPTYEPYYAVGDFDGNGAEDFAIVVKSIRERVDVRVIVFLGRKGKKGFDATNLKVEASSLEGFAIFTRRRSGQRTILLVGPFASEGTPVNVPRQ